MKVIAFIFARGNSKGIKNKNLLKFKKTTLLGHAINQAKKVNNIKEVFVSTDSKKILKHAKKYNAETPFLRPKKFARDNSLEIDAWRHAIRYLKKNMNLTPNYIISIPTTCPLRKVSDINLCLKKALNKKLDMVFTVTKSYKNPYFNIITKKRKRINVVSKFFDKKNKKIIKRRQDAPECFDLTTACYVFKPEYIIKTKNLFSGKIDFVEIPKERGIDIDDIFDYKLVKLISNK